MCNEIQVGDIWENIGSGIRRMVIDDYPTLEENRYAIGNFTLTKEAILTHWKLISRLCDKPKINTNKIKENLIVSLKNIRAKLYDSRTTDELYECIDNAISILSKE